MLLLAFHDCAYAARKMASRQNCVRLLLRKSPDLQQCLLPESANLLNQTSLLLKSCTHQAANLSSASPRHAPEAELACAASRQGKLRATCLGWRLPPAAYAEGRMLPLRLLSSHPKSQPLALPTLLHLEPVLTSSLLEAL